MTAAARKVLFIFLDGVGIGPDDPDVNPFLRAELPTLTAIGGDSLPTLDAPEHASGTGGHTFALSATLDTPGTPQSGTGQVALLTGENAAEIHGSHFGPWTPVGLRPLVEKRSLLRRAVDRGRRVAFANAYPEWWPGRRGGRRVAAPPLAARGAGVLTRHQKELGAGNAISSEIVNDGWREKLGYDWLPDVTEAEAGGNLARIAGDHDLTLYAHYSTDTAGHRDGMKGGVAALERVDRFLGGVLAGVDDDLLVLIASDHGNIEDVTGGHTRNPVLGVAAGPGADTVARLGDIRAVTPFVLELLGVSDAE